MNVINRQFICVMILFLIISLAYSMVIPAFNAPDEPFHFEYIQFLALNRHLPNQTIEERSISTEGFNPPLYYMINALTLSLISKNKASDIQIHSYQDIVDFHRFPYQGFRSNIYPPLNPNYIKWGRGKDRNMFLTTQEDRFPFSGRIRIIHLLRIMSVLMGALTILLIFKTAQNLLPENPNLALLATSICAFNPQFNFLSGSINNDNLVILFATLSICLLTKFMLSEDGKTKWTVVWIGFFIGLGLITKLNIASIAVISMIGIIDVSLAERKRKFKNLIIHFILFFVPIAITSGWYFVRNVGIYGINDPLGWRLQAIQNPGLLMPDRIRSMFFKKIFFQRLFTSFWGQFDWLTIHLPNWGYWIYGLISVMGILGLFLFLLRRKYSRRIKICILLYLGAFLMALGNLILMNFTFISAQARLIFPVLVCIGIFIGMGIASVFEYLSGRLKMKWPIAEFLFMAFLIALDVYALFWVIYPVYRSFH